MTVRYTPPARAYVTPEILILAHSCTVSRVHQLSVTDGVRHGPYNDVHGDCVLPQFLEDSRGLERLDRRDSVPMSLHDECPVDECFSSDLSSPPPSEVGSLCEPAAADQNSSQLVHDARDTNTRTTAAVEASTEGGKLKRKSSRIEVFDPTALEDDWITSVRTRGQLRMILNPVPDEMVKPEPAEQQTYQSPPRKRVMNSTTIRKESKRKEKCVCISIGIYGDCTEF